MSRSPSENRTASSWVKRRPRAESSTIGPVGPKRLHRLEERLRLEHHPRPAAVGVVVDRGVPVVGEVAQLHQAELHQPGRRGPARDARRQIRGDDFGEQGDDVDRQHGADVIPSAARDLLAQSIPSSQALASLALARLA